jgi:phage/plasmid-associated DNA primase
MTDRFKLSSPQEEDIVYKVNQRKARVARTPKQELDSKIKKSLDAAKEHNQEGLEVASALLDELVAAGFRFGKRLTVGSASEDTIESVIYDAHFGVWKPLYQKRTKWETLLRDVGLKGTLDVFIFPAMISEAEARCYKGITVNFDKPLKGVAFENGIFDLGTGKLRDYAPEDFRQFRGRAVYDECAEGAPTLVNELIDYMAAGDDSKAKLIRAACYLNIVGIHTLPAFKSAFFIWACDEGFGGRSSLFNVVQKAAGGDAVVTLSHLKDLTDVNTLLRLQGRNYCYIDECQDVSTARSKAVATLKNITGGVTRLEVWQKHKDKFEIEGHWIVNQAFNGMELLYAADRALIDRCVPIVTHRIPEAAMEAYIDNPQKQKDLVSSAEATRFLQSLWREFGDPSEAARVVDSVKREFERDLESLVSTTEPMSEFAEQWLVAAPGQITPIEKVLDAYNGWLKAMYPTHRQVNVRNISSGLRKQGLQVDRVKLDGTLTTVLIGKEVSGSLHLVRF